MKKISPQDSERLGILLKEMGKIFNRYEIPSLIAFEIDERKGIFSCSGSISDNSYLFVSMVKDLCRHWRVRKEYFVELIKNAM
jgi:hypothetical protein